MNYTPIVCMRQLVVSTRIHIFTKIAITQMHKIPDADRDYSHMQKKYAERRTAYTMDNIHKIVNISGITE